MSPQKPSDAAALTSRVAVLESQHEGIVEDLKELKTCMDSLSTDVTMMVATGKATGRIVKLSIAVIPIVILAVQFFVSTL